MELRGQCRMNKAARGRERRRLKEIQQEEEGEQRKGRGAAFKGYDRVLVDAECTHDGSLRHMAKVRHYGTLSLGRRTTTMLERCKHSLYRTQRHDSCCS
jgi:16S rRNA C967 or C1407 C5-methylase (RsmB/RsmF family)